MFSVLAYNLNIKESNLKDERYKKLILRSFGATVTFSGGSCTTSAFVFWL